MALHVAARAIHLQRQSLDGAGCRLMPAVVGSPFGSPHLISAANVHGTGADWGRRRGAAMAVVRPAPICMRTWPAGTGSDRGQIRSSVRHPPITKAKGCPYAALCAPHLARSKLGHAERMFRAKVREGPVRC